MMHRVDGRDGLVPYPSMNTVGTLGPWVRWIYLTHPFIRTARDVGNRIRMPYLGWTPDTCYN
uniref:Uncharacterized protein n=2 Tax=Picea TaxID=3328 RepID=A0A101M190_PICGL|nr:hypothetical protein ABT39_MTgene4372 [Picea glauca]QHR91789.1 hypothetical protein Q903MT_gene5825 [Picea sitchensis]